jgi:putative adenylate-forming enzyme
MNFAYQRRRLADMAAAVRAARSLAVQERWPVQRLREHQQERLDALVRHAVAASPFHRERLGPHVGDGPVRLADLPVMGKAEMMDRFDEVVTDPRLRRDELLERAERAMDDGLHLGRYRVMASSGSSGRKGLYVYDAPGWRSIMAGFMRYNAIAGISPRLPRLRIAAVVGAAPTHMTRQVTSTASVGLHRVLSLPSTMPVREQVEALQAFQPDVLGAYPSAILPLADEQLAGRLQLRLRGITTSSELRTPEMTERIREAFGVAPFDLYGTTEGLWGCECEQHDGLHFFEDLVLVENASADGRPVPPGERGERLLVTNLANLVQPLIRFEVSDVVRLATEPCPCGRTLVRTAAVDGRRDDVLHLPGRDGTDVEIQPILFAPVTRDRDVREFQVVQEGPDVRILVVPREGSANGFEQRITEAIVQRLAEAGVARPQVSVERCAELQRTAGGKLQIVVSDRPRGSCGP